MLILLVGLQLAHAAMDGCAFAHTCDLCLVQTPKAGETECVWCTTPALVGCIDVGNSGACAGFGTVYTGSDTCPVVPLACNDYGATCDNCTTNSPLAGLVCEWCTGVTDFIGEIASCLPSGSGVCTTVGATPASVCLAPPRPSEGCTEVPEIGDIHVATDGTDNDCCCGSAGAPCQSIECGMLAAKFSEREVEVIVQSGTYSECRVRVASIPAVTVRSESGAAATIVDCEGTGGPAFLFEDSQTSSFVMDGFTIRNAVSSESGGGLRVVGCSPTLRNLVIEDCTAAVVAFDGPAIRPALNSAFGGGAYFVDSETIMENVVFQNNALNYPSNKVYGGAVYALQSSLMFRACEFRSNTAIGQWSTGSAVSMELVFIGPSVFEDCIFDSNVAGSEKLTQGALAVELAGGAVLRGTTFSNNIATGANSVRAAGMFLDKSFASFERCVFTDNSASGIRPMGAGLFIESIIEIYVLRSFIRDCVFERNVCDGEEAQGGGLFATSAGAYFLEVTNSTFLDNTATGSGVIYGGGASVEGGYTMTNLIVRRNEAISTDDMAFGGGISVRKGVAPDLSSVTNCELTANYVRGGGGGETVVMGGGGLAVSGSTPHINDCEISSNTVTSGPTGARVCCGGGVLFHQAFFGTVYPEITHSVVASNTVDCEWAVLGGGIGVNLPYGLIVRDTLVENNLALGTQRAELDSLTWTFGGGIGTSIAPMFIYDTIVRSNTIRGYQTMGGGVAITSLDSSASVAKFENVHISDNLVDSFANQAEECSAGGMVVANQYGTMFNVTIERNKVQTSSPTQLCVGAAMTIIIAAVDGPIVFENSHIVNNIGYGPDIVLGRGRAINLVQGNIELIRTHVCGNGPAGSQVACLVTPCRVTGTSGYHMDAVTDIIPNSCAGTCETMCSGNGVCNATLCECDAGYFGELCEFECNGGGLPPCSGHGVCNNGREGDGTCACQPGYWDIGCTQECLNNCSYPFGTCDSGESGDGNCTCLPTYYSKDCGKRCPAIVTQYVGTPDETDSPCNDVGVCHDGRDGNGDCECNVGYTGATCEDCYLAGGRACHLKCPGNGTCSGHGTCNTGIYGDGKCTCFPGYYDVGCEGECPGGADNPCFGHGVCDDGTGGGGRCSCQPRYNTEIGCQRCTGYFDNCTKPCPSDAEGTACSGSSTGECDELGQCICDAGASGSACEVRCPGFVVGSDLVCSGQGTCRGGECICDDGYGGDACQIEGGTSVGTIIAIAIIVPCFILVLAGVLFYVWFTQKACFAIYADDDGATAQHVKGDDGQMKTYVNRLLNQRNTRLLGQGGAADVYKVRLASGEWVAMKKLRTKDPLELEEFHSEVNILSSFVANETHKHIVKLLFFCDDPPVIGMELCEGGSMAQLLYGTKKLSADRKIELSHDTATGLCFLHTNKVAHLDLKPDNVLLNKQGHVKITDFGISQMDQDVPSDSIAGTIQYMAPERFKNAMDCDPYACDTYAFGVLMWTVWSRKKPYAEKMDATTMRNMLLDGKRVKRPPVPSDCSVMYGELMTRCWAEDPVKRPEMNEVASVIENLDSDKEIDMLIRAAPDLRSITSQDLMPV